MVGGSRGHLGQEQLARTARQISRGTFTSADAGHFVHVDNPRAFLSALRSSGVG